MKLESDTTLIERLALGLFNAIVGFVTGLILWLAINSLFLSSTTLIPFEAVLWFTAITGLLGMVVHDALLTSLYARIWRFLIALFR
ncbi:MAG: hypothetical protein N0C84_13005 [Candidatus Thiodiazotropha taylori]|uniref:Uncharacterized protein n=1 Tax=Candidatus Thiodiazotropha taylori TaxID=2792791 RepID=A0A9E4KES5_9GAMM|nr:hypothetical protein [Candidatus Thiodiazotropha taylori]RLW69910.1 MAG: hypothetical protein B6D71_08480 [gamma proteobacterium symbiont of Stewartia floridana]MCG7954605.1 hypothetical protein [Candidatus Thiodiazotropha taylori]MCG7965554.1 hypothetical protein [Candidatus Thiodiazotropha taylori]MCG8042617.1 hypothetical protein [Candidatus Thiodiazotropha taylori]